MWQCPGVENYCVNVSQVCDGNKDCPNGRDEGEGCKDKNCDTIDYCKHGCLQLPNVSYFFIYHIHCLELMMSVM